MCLRLLTQCKPRVAASNLRSRDGDARSSADIHRSRIAPVSLRRNDASRLLAPIRRVRLFPLAHRVLQFRARGAYIPLCATSNAARSVSGVQAARMFVQFTELTRRPYWNCGKIAVTSVPRALKHGENGLTSVQNEL